MAISFNNEAEYNSFNDHFVIFQFSKNETLNEYEIENFQFFEKCNKSHYPGISIKEYNNNYLKHGLCQPLDYS